LLYPIVFLLEDRYSASGIFSCLMSHGTLEVIVGCMSSGKSEELIRRIRRATIAKQSVVVCKPAVDSRSGEAVASRDGATHRAINVHTADEILSAVNTTQQVVGLDEVQFFDARLLDIVRILLEKGVRVIAAGLDTDFRGKPFDLVAKLMADADTVTKLTAVCVRCGGQAIRTQRLIGGAPAPHDSPRIVVGGDDLYEARCRNCHEVPRPRDPSQLPL
jgi:thymidine kinase